MIRKSRPIVETAQIESDKREICSKIVYLFQHICMDDSDLTNVSKSGNICNFNKDFTNETDTFKFVVSADNHDGDFKTICKNLEKMITAYFKADEIKYKQIEVSYTEDTDFVCFIIKVINNNWHYSVDMFFDSELDGDEMIYTYSLSDARGFAQTSKKLTFNDIVNDTSMFNF